MEWVPYLGQDRLYNLVAIREEGKNEAKIQKITKKI